jgi:hypothetical protein
VKLEIKQWITLFASAKGYRRREKPSHAAQQNKTPGRVKKSDLVNKYIKQFTQFINSVDFDKM